MKVKIISDSSCDVWALGNHDFSTAPLTISTKERTFVDDETIDVHEMLDYLARYKDRSFTACPSIQQWLDCFGDADEIYVATITSALSGAYNSAVQAKDMYLEQNPDAKVLIIDSKSTAGDLLLLLEKVRALKEGGKTFEEVCEAMGEYQKHTRLFFAFKSIHNLAQNGRVPKIVDKAVGILGLSIMGTASEAGEVAPDGKARGQKAVIQGFMDRLTEAGYNGGKINIHHSENPELAQALFDEVKSKYPDAALKIVPMRGLVSYYAERYSVVIGAEVNM